MGGLCTKPDQAIVIAAIEDEKPNYISRVEKKQEIVILSETTAPETKQEVPVSQELRAQLSFKDYKGFKEIKSIRDSYKMGRELGAGSFGTVNLAKHKATDRKVAIKVIKK